MATSAVGAARPVRRPQKFDLPAWARIALATAGGALSLIALYGVTRGILGLASPRTLGGLREAAVIVHLTTVIPALPLGAYVLLQRKGGPRHRLLGRIWLSLMLATALSTVFIRHLNHGRFSWIHLFTLLAFITVPRALLAARRGQVDKHKKIITGFYLGALLIAGFFSFLPGRLMWHLVTG